MTDLQVDTEGLRTLSRTLAEVRGALDATRRIIDAGRDALGDNDVYDALNDFENNWDDGRGQINNNMQAMQEILDESANAYETTDGDLATQLHDNMRETTTTRTTGPM